MPDHLIRLRGGWLRHDGPRAGSPDDSPGPGRVVTLPMALPASSGGRVRLSRRFGLPPFDPDAEALSLRLGQVVGLATVSLNGLEVARPTVGTTALEIPLPAPLPGRNLLVLDVDFPDDGSPSEPWGMVALVIAPGRASAGPGARGLRGEAEEDELGDGRGRP